MAAGDQDEAGSFDDSPDEILGWQEQVRLQALAHLHRAPPRVPSVVRIGVLSVIVLLHGVGFMHVYTSHQPSAVHDDMAVIVRLIDEAPRPTSAALPTQIRSSRPPAQANRVQTIPRSEAIQAQVTEADAPAPTVQLFNADGSARLSSPDTWRSPKEQVAAELMQRGHNIIHCRQTRFAADYARDETLGDKVSRKYLAWIGMADMSGIEERAARNKAEAAEACDG